MIDAFSPNFNDRDPSMTIEYIVMHYTGMKTAQDALDRMLDPAAQVSAHYMIDEDGTTIRMVPDEKRAWHAGVSFWRGRTDLNSLSIGIELVNPGHEFGYRPFTSQQIDSALSLAQAIKARHHLSDDCLLAHSDIAPERRYDPGIYFPWEHFANERLGFWPRPDKDDCTETFTQTEISALLERVGYNINNSQAAAEAFLRRYAPECIATGFNAKAFGQLRALARHIA